MPKITDARKQEQRDRILRATIRTCAQHGFRGASMARIVKESGLSAGALYTYFSTKEELEAAAAEHFLHSRSDALQSILAQDPLPAPGEALRTFLGTFPLELLDEGLLLQLWGEAVATDHLRETAQHFILSLTESMEEYLTAWLTSARGLDDDDAAARAASLAPAIVALSQGHIIRRAILGAEEKEPYLDGVELLLSSL